MWWLFNRSKNAPRKEKSPLLYFYGVECTHCDLMEPLMKQLEEETGMTLRKFEVWYNDDNLRLLQKLDRDGVCNGVPFFYSKVKRDWICGATIYPNFKAWALGKPHERFLSPPTEDSEVMGQFKGFFDRIKNTGFQTLRDRMEAGKRLAAAYSSHIRRQAHVHAQEDRPNGAE
ncbi:Thioredoxin-like protein [Gracilaria domingensis]|nr:Thioredoxin-like protein [Gracilaria domingensis]